VRVPAAGGRGASGGGPRVSEGLEQLFCEADLLFAAPESRDFYSWIKQNLSDFGELEDMCGKTSLSEKLPVTKSLPGLFSPVLYAYSRPVPSSFPSSWCRGGGSCCLRLRWGEQCAECIGVPAARPRAVCSVACSSLGVEGSFHNCMSRYRAGQESSLPRAGTKASFKPI